MITTLVLRKQIKYNLLHKVTEIVTQLPKLPSNVDKCGLNSVIHSIKSGVLHPVSLFLCQRQYFLCPLDQHKLIDSNDSCCTCASSSLCLRLESVPSFGSCLASESHVRRRLLIWDDTGEEIRLDDFQLIITLMVHYSQWSTIIHQQWSPLHIYSTSLDAKGNDDVTWNFQPPAAAKKGFNCFLLAGNCTVGAAVRETLEIPQNDHINRIILARSNWPQPSSRVIQWGVEQSASPLWSADVHCRQCSSVSDPPVKQHTADEAHWTCLLDDGGTHQWESVCGPTNTANDGYTGQKVQKCAKVRHQEKNLQSVMRLVASLYLSRTSSQPQQWVVTTGLQRKPMRQSVGAEEPSCLLSKGHRIDGWIFQLSMVEEKFYSLMTDRAKGFQKSRLG